VADEIALRPFLKLSLIENRFTLRNPPVFRSSSTMPQWLSRASPQPAPDAPRPYPHAGVLPQIRQRSRRDAPELAPIVRALGSQAPAAPAVRDTKGSIRPKSLLHGLGAADLDRELAGMAEGRKPYLGADGREASQVRAREAEVVLDLVARHDPEVHVVVQAEEAGPLAGREEEEAARLVAGPAPRREELGVEASCRVDSEEISSQERLESLGRRAREAPVLVERDDDLSRPDAGRHEVEQALEVQVVE